ncbi:ABC transporter permease [Ancylobacter mangrovi]|uniref:ABC transporter permease n=1 Tax=Ancylobacter mangrovi TaxID=2972472 RepID=A0A9X2PEY7_9HYPH|nr:ABC transporter permease [Ancylobacter mangrovi]MCS0497459.1 ABC transporter permease [Ancylobacter mangrovi]MCS0503991.1 ABC transporter permease [Ancylobacter mangrovi]
MNARIDVWVLGASVVAVLLYLLFPIVVVIGASFNPTTALQFPPSGFSLKWYQEIAGNPDWINAFIVTLEVGAITTLLSLLFGVPAGFALSRYRVKGKTLVTALLLSALVAPHIVRAVSTYLFYVPLGLNNTILGLAIAHSIGGIPFVVINLGASLRSFDPTLERAAVIHGAHPVRAVLTITFPVVAPGIIVGALFAFMQSAQELLISIFVLGTLQMPIAVKLWEGVRVAVDPTLAAASSLLVLAALGFFLLAALARRGAAPAPNA